jgi:CubicO group peptidase (beta-lactamase class C family)
MRNLVMLVLSGAIFAGTALAQAPQALPDAAQSDPAALHWMEGFPPPADKTIRISDGSAWKFPQLRWSFNHMRELGPTADVSRGEGTAVALPSSTRDLSGVAFSTTDGEPMTFAEALSKTYSDGIVVLHKGQVVFEKYFGAGAPQRPHIGMSMTKSFVGTLAAMLIAERKLDRAAPVIRYIPELDHSAYADATVDQVMDMRIGIKYSETYADPKSEIWDYIRAGGWFPLPPDYNGAKTLYDFLVKLEKEGQHGGAFGYKTPNAEVLAWIVQRASGRALADLLAERIWSKLGAEQDGYFLLDSAGTASGGGGFVGTVRDFARFGEAMRNHGRFNGQQIIPESVVAEIFRGGDREAFAPAGFKTLPGWSYRDMWWISHNEHGAIMARGIHGQNIYLDPAAEMVIARVASHPIAANAANDPITLPAYAAIANALMK